MTGIYRRLMVDLLRHSDLGRCVRCQTPSNGAASAAAASQSPGSSAGRHGFPHHHDLKG